MKKTIICDNYEVMIEILFQAINLVDIFGKGPLITFHLQWKDNLVNGTVDRPQPTANPDDLLNSDHLSG